VQAKILNLPRLGKQLVVASLDVFTALIATWLAFSLRLWVWHWPDGSQWIVYVLAPVLVLPVFTPFGLYLAVFRYTGLSALITVGKAVAVYGVLFFSILVWLHLPSIPRSIGVLQPLLFLNLVGASRALARFWLNSVGVSGRPNRQVLGRLLIYGAGSAGAQIAGGLANSHEFKLVGFLDDDVKLQGKTINGQRIYSPSSIASLITRYAVTDVLLALPSISRGRRNEIISSLKNFPVHIRTLPGFTDMARGKVSVSDIHELDIEDLLGRDAVPPSPILIGRNITGKVVMVTGAGGSIGSELCRQILSAKPTKLLLLDHSEYNLYAVHTDLILRQQEVSPQTELVPLLGNVCDYGRLREVCRAWRPSTVYHAAAYKHVPMVEHNPAEGLRNNVFGTLTAARAAMEMEVADFVLISTDKAVRPTNIMGASKRIAEMILQALSDTELVLFEGVVEQGKPFKNNTRFSMVRFGNVLGSSGSVVPLFRQQIRDGGPITLTHPEITRFFMTIPEAAQLVLQAGAMAEGGDVFVLDMGEPVKIYDLARRMIELSGLIVKDTQYPDGDIEIKVTGLRPGEKLYEELLIGNDPQPTLHPRIMKAHEDFIAWSLLSKHLQNLRGAMESNDVNRTRSILTELVNGYRPSQDMMDLVYLAGCIGFCDGDLGGQRKAAS